MSLNFEKQKIVETSYMVSFFPFLFIFVELLCTCLFCYFKILFVCWPMNNLVHRMLDSNKIDKQFNLSKLKQSSDFCCVLNYNQEKKNLIYRRILKNTSLS